MKKILPLLLVSFLAPLIVPAEDVLKLPEAAERRSPLDGVWYRHTKGVHGYKIFADGRIHVTQVDEDSGLVINQFVGVFAVKDGNLHEKALACSKKWDFMKDDARVYRLEIGKDGKSFTMIYPKGNREEWVRSK